MSIEIAVPALALGMLTAAIVGRGAGNTSTNNLELAEVPGMLTLTIPVSPGFADPLADSTNWLFEFASERLTPCGGFDQLAAKESVDCWLGDDVQT